MALWDLSGRFAEETGRSLLVAHVDHGLRGRASRADAAFVRREARRRKMPCRVARAPVRAWAEKNKRGVEEAARILRYKALGQMAKAARCHAVLTAHHRDDQVETVFLNLLRGAGPGGLSGMAPASPWPWPGGPRGARLVRPLLDTSREAILRYARRRGLSWRRDATNDAPVFLRNRLRPMLRRWESWRPGFFQRTAQLAALQRDEEAFWRERLDALSGEIFRRRRAGGGLEASRLKRYHLAEQRRLLRRYLRVNNFAALERARLYALAPGSAGPLSFPGGQIVKKAGVLRFQPLSRMKSPRNQYLDRMLQRSTDSLEVS